MQYRVSFIAEYAGTVVVEADHPDTAEAQVQYLVEHHVDITDQGVTEIEGIDQFGWCATEFTGTDPI